MGNKAKIGLALGILSMMLIGMAAPALAYDPVTNIEGAPDLEASVVGSNEFLVGETGTLQISVHNSGTYSGKIKELDDKVMALGYRTSMGTILINPCTTALNVNATIKSDTPSIEFLGDTAGIGTLPSGGAAMQPLTFRMRVSKDVSPGEYMLDLELEYTYLENISWLNEISYPEYANETQVSPYYEPEFKFFWGIIVQTVSIPVQVTGTHFSAEIVGLDDVRVGATGVITAVIANSGLGEANDATAEIVPGGNFVPVDKGTFLGDLPGGESSEVKFRAEVPDEAIAKISPLDILIKYKDENDVPRQSQLTVGIPVGEEIEFSLVEHDNPGIPTVTPGSEMVLTVPIENSSDVEAGDILARVNVIDPFSSTDELSYIGTLQPGESGTARFKIKADGDALPKPYALDVVVKYWDDEGNSYTSDPMKVQLEVVTPVDTSKGRNIGIAAGISAGVAYYFLHKKKLLNKKFFKRRFPKIGKKSAAAKR